MGKTTENREIFLIGNLWPPNFRGLEWHCRFVYSVNLGTFHFSHILHAQHVAGNTSEGMGYKSRDQWNEWNIELADLTILKWQNASIHASEVMQSWNAVHSLIVIYLPSSFDPFWRIWLMVCIICLLAVICSYVSVFQIYNLHQVPSWSELSSTTTLFIGAGAGPSHLIGVLAEVCIFLQMCHFLQ